MAEQKVSEKPVLDQLYDLLNDSKQPQTFYDLLKMISANKLDEEERAEYYARVYTNLNLDGRFLSLGNNFWGLKSWYPMDQRDEDVASKLAPKRKRKSSDDDDDLEDVFADFDDDDVFDDIDDDDIYDDDDDLDEDFNDDDDEYSDDDDDLDEEYDDEDDEDEEEED
ncbi:DNA-directed RNA polymerase subunit delta [Pullulanibacillus pueri]|uniref:Probable DNA-directed RNA polymerase subunit delta n=1 Tax=Pullulanibacillus pueri TaxID=1437324 RepID=A0A8J2ZZ37_9BACL|nr:DNA-directed RNA polymerase subunit delta [Pullulanibacillus pueri]MBM7681704.1 DNA-directed RNA polymerase subunit delta [Pullulanibacillus pueri]GGH87067.1 hypothetical protein GCM10007096_36230 [Pullulanibacillus pueri]